MKKFIALFLVFLLLALSGNLYANERKGAKLIVQKKYGQQIRGELIAVKGDSLLLLDAESGIDMSVDIGEIKIIKIVKKSKFLDGSLFGLLIVGSLLVYAINEARSDWPGGTLRLSTIGIVTACSFGTLFGGLIGVSLGKDKIFLIEGKSNLEIREVLEELRSKARVRNFQ